MTGMTKSLGELIRGAIEATAKMTHEEREAMYARQREGYAKAEASWPKPRFQMINGVKVYLSYEDYCND